MTVVAVASDGRHDRVLGAGDRRLVEEDVGADAAVGRVEDVARRVPVSTVPPSASRARKWVSIRRRPITSPPGGGRCTWPNRASSGPASRIEARIFLRLGVGILAVDAVSV